MKTKNHKITTTIIPEFKAEDFRKVELHRYHPRSDRFQVTTIKMGKGEGGIACLSSLQFDNIGGEFTCNLAVPFALGIKFSDDTTGFWIVLGTAPEGITYLDCTGQFDIGYRLLVWSHPDSPDPLANDKEGQPRQLKWLNRVYRKAHELI